MVKRIKRYKVTISMGVISAVLWSLFFLGFSLDWETVVLGIIGIVGTLVALVMLSFREKQGFTK